MSTNPKEGQVDCIAWFVVSGNLQSLTVLAAAGNALQFIEFAIKLENSC